MYSRQIMHRAVAWMAVIVLVSGCAGMMTETPESLIREAQALYLSKDYDGAIVKYERAIALDKTAWMAYLGMARCYIAKGGWLAAITNARTAFGLAPNSTDVVAVFGEALFGGGRDALLRGQFKDAIGYFVEYVRVKPTDALGYLNAGKAYLGDGAWAEALRVLVQGLQLTGGSNQQEFLQALLAGGTGALTHGSARDAIGFFQQYLQHDSTSLTALLNLGKAYWQNGDLLQAVNTYRQALNLSPGNEEASRFLRGMGR